jgi:hypothetical protein
VSTSHRATGSSCRWVRLDRSIFVLWDQSARNIFIEVEGSKAGFSRLAASLVQGYLLDMHAMCEMRILLMAANKDQGPILLPDRTNCILLVSMICHGS